MRAAYLLARRALTSSASSATRASHAVSEPSVDSYRAALLVLVSGQHSKSLHKPISSFITCRQFSQAAVAEESQANIQLTEAAVEVRVTSLMGCHRVTACAKPFLLLQRLQELNQKESNSVLRLRVDAGGCSGFSYVFDLERDPPPEDM